MKQPKHIKEAHEIGRMSFALLNYEALPKNASVNRQVEALKRDQSWQEDHQAEVSARIDRLIARIEGIAKETRP